jgi:hypothetical protein
MTFILFADDINLLTTGIELTSSSKRTNIDLKLLITCQQNLL